MLEAGRLPRVATLLPMTPLVFALWCAVGGLAGFLGLEIFVLAISFVGIFMGGAMAFAIKFGASVLFLLFIGCLAWPRQVPIHEVWFVAMPLGMVLASTIRAFQLTHEAGGVPAMPHLPLLVLPALLIGVPSALLAGTWRGRRLAYLDRVVRQSKRKLPVGRNKLMAEVERRAEALEAEMKALRGRATLAASGILALGALVTGSLYRFIDMDHSYLIIALAAAIAASFWPGIKYRRAFSRRVMPELARVIDPSLTFTKDGLLPEEVFKRSLFVTKVIRYYRGEDLVQGQFRDREVALCELTVADFTPKNGDPQFADFHGPFLTSPAAPIAGHVVVMTAPVDELFFPVEKQIERLSATRGDRVVLGDAAFDAAFVVFASARSLAHDVLTPDLRARLLALRERLHAGIQLSFTYNGDQVYLGASDLDYGWNLFERSANGGTERAAIVRTARELLTVLDWLDGLRIPGGAPRKAAAGE